MKKNRIWELDFIRGFAIVMVVVDHTMYDFAYLFSSWKRCGNDFLQLLNAVGLSYMTGDVRFFWRPSFLFLFFFVSGICTALSRNNFVRGFRLFAVAIGLSIVTYIAQLVTGEDCFILLGVLHCLALITLSYAVCRSLLDFFFFLYKKASKKEPKKKVTDIVSFVFFLLLASVFLLINQKYNVRLYEVFGAGRTVSYNRDWRGLFFYEDSWWTADYFPLFPFISFFFLGSALAPLLYGKKKTLFPSLEGKWHYVFSYPGKYSLWVYLLGQVVSLSVCLLLDAVLL